MRRTVEVPGELLDLRRYPVDRLSSPERERLLAACRSEFGVNGACVLPGFVTPAGVELMLEEARARLPLAFFCHKSHNAYLLDDDPSFDEDHPRRRQLQTDVGSIAYDDLPAEGVLRRFYAWDPLTRFIGAVLGHESFYRIADPLGAASVNVFEPGAGHAWHFDESLFSVTLMLQTAERGDDSSMYPTSVPRTMTPTKRLGASWTATGVRSYGYLSSPGRCSSSPVATRCIASLGWKGIARGSCRSCATTRSPVL